MGPKNQITPPTAMNQAREKDKERKNAHITFQPFKFEEKFSRKLGTDIIAYLKTYEEACMEYKLSEARELQYVNNFFGGEAKLFTGIELPQPSTTTDERRNLLLKLPKV